MGVLGGLVVVSGVVDILVFIFLVFLVFLVI